MRQSREAADDHAGRVFQEHNHDKQSMRANLARIPRRELLLNEDGKGRRACGGGILKQNNYEKSGVGQLRLGEILTSIGSSKGEGTK